MTRPRTDDELTVGHAKYVYNRPAAIFRHPPRQALHRHHRPAACRPAATPTMRAPSTSGWCNDWLRENNYPLNNVAVFDFYNVLTDPDNHHRYHDGQIEYITDHGGNTLYYTSSGDDHPNEAGSQKATEEFLPLLNIFYHRWAATAPSVLEESNPPAPQATQPGITATQPGIAATQPGILADAAWVDDFEGGVPAGTNGWEAFADEAALSSLRCAPESGALHIQADIAPEIVGFLRAVLRCGPRLERRTGAGNHHPHRQPGYPGQYRYLWRHARRLWYLPVHPRDHLRDG